MVVRSVPKFLDLTLEFLGLFSDNPGLEFLGLFSDNPGLNFGTIFEQYRIEFSDCYWTVCVVFMCYC